MSDWSPTSWRSHAAAQQPAYEDPAALDRAVKELSTRPPLVALGEVERLRAELALAAEGRRFVLHGGDCAERFADCTRESLTAKFQVLLQMSLVLTYATRRPVIRIGRIAGQYAKPRSADTETVGGAALPVYRGDLVNDVAATPEARRADPARLVDGYYHSAASLNFLRALIEGGFADLHHPEQWDLGFIEQSRNSVEYRRVVDAIRDAVTFMETVGGAAETLQRVSMHTSHEALLLPYEEAMTRREGESWINSSAHFLWLGYRTAQPDSAHVEYLRGVRNPIGVKVGPGTNVERLLGILNVLDPNREPGRVTLITRFGAERAASDLPPLLQAVSATRRQVVWSCDPMHGNTRPAGDGRKTRRMSDIFAEIEQTFEAHEAVGTRLGGVHFEMTGEAVTECLGGSGGVEKEDLGLRYQTACDPRMNGAQALEMAFLIARFMR